MHTNAIESWLARMHRHAHRASRCVDWYFHVQIGEPGQLEEHYPECSNRIIRSPCRLSEWSAFFRDFYRLCRVQKFDVVHIHADLTSAPYLLAARLAGVPRVIVHVHNADEAIPTSNPLKRVFLKPLMRQTCLLLADRIVGISNHTLDTFLAGRIRRAKHDIVHYYGIEPTAIQKSKSDRAGFRRELGFKDDVRVLLFAGRVVPEKNPLFAVDVLSEMRKIDPGIVGVFVGAGSLDGAVRQRAVELGLGGAFRQLGWRNDVADVMSCCDWFILPRPEQPMEGFGIAVMEAQLAGLRLLLSQGIADDPLLPTAVYRRLPLASGARMWAEAALELLRQPAPSRAAALDALHSSPMEMNRALDALLRLYE